MKTIDHPDHYGGADNPYEAIKVIEAWDTGFHLSNVLKYVSRAGKKPGVDILEDLKKAAWYLDRYITVVEQEINGGECQGFLVSNDPNRSDQRPEKGQSALSEPRAGTDPAREKSVPDRQETSSPLSIDTVYPSGWRFGPRTIQKRRQAYFGDYSKASGGYAVPGPVDRKGDAILKEASDAGQ